ncbi:hypothetical protein CORMATOL_02428 [Corynebacterium matruchotii ATCC 33806]|uniref:Uncharacterized protein n=1 Tax=Corynebacterium matruchotii ATCC 33806 TaxID=566549 RepID=C0E5Z6_9CORY|nr:hypothetical protein CORMATOL_02428 [Corynebacterium matruchotii ATCC 33806]
MIRAIRKADRLHPVDTGWFCGVSCVFALAGVLVFGRFLPGRTGAAGRNPS